MTETESVTQKLAAMLRHPEDLDRIPALKADIALKKATIDGQVRIGLKEYQHTTRSGMNSIIESQELIAKIKREMMHMDRLCVESQTLIPDFPDINKVAQTHRNFELVEAMKQSILNFQSQLEELEHLLREDEEDMYVQQNLLLIHFNLTKLRNFRDEVYEQRKQDPSSVAELVDHLDQLDRVIDQFDSHIFETCVNMIPIIQDGNDNLVVRTVLVIEAEEKCDLKSKAVMEAQRDYKELTSRFKSIATGGKELRGYKERFIQTIEDRFTSRLPELTKKFQDDPSTLEKSMKWYFNDLNTVKLGMVPLMPKRWRIFHTYVEIYHTLFHDWLISCLGSDDFGPPKMLEVIKFVDIYYSKMKKLGAPEEAMKLHLIDNRTGELVEKYRQLIVKFVNERMDSIIKSDTEGFLNRSGFQPDYDERGMLRVRGMADMWVMLTDQLSVVEMSGRTDVADGAIETMTRVLAARQQNWKELLSAEMAKYTETFSEADRSEFQSYLIAVGNDQFACIENRTENGEIISGSLIRFGNMARTLVSENYLEVLNENLEMLEDKYIELSTICLSLYTKSVFVFDLRKTLAEVFTESWYEQKHIPKSIRTFTSHLDDLTAVCHPWLQPIIQEELVDELLIWYLGAVGNPSAKVKNVGQFIGRVNMDLSSVFEYFSTYPEIGEGAKERWKAVMFLTDLLSCKKEELAEKVGTYWEKYPDTSLNWVEAVLRMRADWSRSLMKVVNGVVEEMGDVRGETIMGRVRLLK